MGNLADALEYLAQQAKAKPASTSTGTIAKSSEVTPPAGNANEVGEENVSNTTPPVQENKTDWKSMLGKAVKLSNGVILQPYPDDS
jgi:hypothetical protein